MTAQSLSSRITSLIRDGEIPLSDAWGNLLDDVAAVERKLLAAHEQEPEPDLYLCPVTRNGERLFSPCGRDYPRGRGYYTHPAPVPAVKDEQEAVSFDALRDAVAEMTGGRPKEWREGVSKGHQDVPFMNFNSLGRIVDKFRVVAAPVPVSAHEQEPVADVVTWSHPQHPQQTCNIRWRRFDVAPGPLYTHSAPSIPNVSFYRDGIAAAAAWVDAQREAYDNEHGRHDPDTGTFEFGNDAQLEYSSTLVEIAEGIRALHPNASSALSIPAAVPEGWKLVPVIADADMSHAGHMYYQQSKRDTGDFTPTGMFSAMIKASPAAPAPAVPDEIDIKQAYQYMRSNSLAGCYRDGWNDRDAMLNHSGVPDEDQ